MARWPEKDKNNRKERVILGNPRRTLEQIDKEDGYIYRYFNDDGSRISDATGAGYEFVQKDQIAKTSEAGVEKVDGIDSREAKVVGSKKNGEPIMAYLMRKEKELHEEDQATKQAVIDEMETTLHRDNVASGTNIPPDKRYGNISIKKGN